MITGIRGSRLNAYVTQALNAIHSNAFIFVVAIFIYHRLYIFGERSFVYSVLFLATPLPYSFLITVVGYRVYTYNTPFTYSFYIFENTLHTHPTHPRASVGRTFTGLRETGWASRRYVIQMSLEAPRAHELVKIEDSR